MDWNDALSSLKGSLPDGSEDNTPATPEKSVAKPRLDIILEKKRRAGKSVTIISGFTAETDEEILQLAAYLKSSLGTGGSARGGEILIQGDRRADVGRLLANKGYKSRVI